MQVNIEDVPNWTGGLDYCRQVMPEAQGEELVVCRYNVPAYTIKRISDGAALRTTTNTRGAPVIVKWKGKK